MKPILVERYADNGEHSHWELIDESGSLLWSQDLFAALSTRGKDAVEFANFVGDRPLPEYSKSTNQWRWWDNSKREYAYATTEELYQLFLTIKQ